MSFNLVIFSSEYFAPIIGLLGLVGNLFGVLVISKKKLVKIGPQIVYTALFIFDLINLILIFQPYLLFGFNNNVIASSSLTCKSYWYVNYVLGPISPMLNVYISIERYISIFDPKNKYFLLKNQIQFIFIIGLTVFNMLLYAPIGIFLDLVILENQTVCYFIHVYWNDTYGYIDLINRVIIPFILMIIFSILIIQTIFKTRTRISSSNRAQRTFQKDVRFSLIIILLNISYIIFSLPLSVILLFPNFWLSSFYIFFTFVYYMVYSTNFYLMFAVNSRFRKGFYSIFCLLVPNENNDINALRENIALQNLQNNRIIQN